MNTKTQLATAVANVAVTAKINAANESAKSADTLAREAATIANEADHVDEVDCGKRLDLILALYMSVLTHKAVKESFSAALAILVADKPVRIESSAVTTAANGKMTFKAPEVLEPVAATGEVVDPEKSITELSAGDAVMKLAADTMKQAATVARKAVGRGRATGGGRPSTKPAIRAPFLDECAGFIRDHALRASMFAVVQTAAKADKAVETELLEMARNLGWHFSRQEWPTTKAKAAK